MRKSCSVRVIIPMLNEAETIGKVLRAIPDWVDETIVADNGSSDGSPEIAEALGAKVVFEPRRGYGAACLRAMKEIPGEQPQADHVIVVFLDGDFSDDPQEMDRLVDPIVADQSDFVLGSRVEGPCERGALSLAQRFGSLLSAVLIKRLFGVHYTDLGPFRAIRWDKLRELEMDDLDFGWTVQMQVRAAKRKMRVLEIPVTYRNRAGGASKVSGTLRGVWGAGTTILKVIFFESSLSRCIRAL